MLKDPRGNEIVTLPHPDEYKDILKHLNLNEQKELTEILVGLIKKASYHNSYILGGKYIKAIPRLNELLLKSADDDELKSGRYFGLYLFITFMQLDDEWYVQKCSKIGRFAGMGYEYYKRKTDLKKRYLAM
jgi:hypothetical protein